MIPLDYGTLRLIWWVLLGVLLIGFAVMDGFDIGIAMLLPITARTDIERRIVINTIGPVWEGNQVWFILGAGAIFAAWPMLYAVSFSGLYLMMFVILLTFIMRPVSFKYRSKMPNACWRNTWDSILAATGFGAALLLGVVVGNVIQGLPFRLDPSLRSFYDGTFLALLNPFAIVCGLLSLFMLMMHGGLYLAIKTDNIIHKRAITASRLSAIAVIMLFAFGGYWVAHGLIGYHLVSSIAHDGPSNPLHKIVIRQAGAWLTNYHTQPISLAAPILGFVGAILACLLTFTNKNTFAFIASGLSIAGIISTVGVSLFPFILPSSISPQSSLLVWDASSSSLTLFTMLVVTALFLPIIFLYTAWVYRQLRGKITEDFVNRNSSAY